MELLPSLQLSKSSHHVFDNTHSIFIQSEGQQIFCCVTEIRKHKLDGENFQNSLYKMSRVIVSTELIKILAYLQDNHSVLLIKSKMRDESLKSMSSLLIFDEITEIRHYLLKDF